MCDNSFVNIQQHSLNYRSQWLRKPFASGHFSAWLIEAGSLTARLQQRYAHFAVQTVRLDDAKPLQEEASLLRAPSHHVALIREVLLKGNGQSVVFAHSVLPKSSLRGGWCKLGRLGDKPLGTILFSNPAVKRTPLSYKKLSANHALYQRAIQHSQQKPSYLWARRSIFSLNCANIMVTEVFFPALIDKLKVNKLK
jgi:chorismate--pyruvate lyase